MGLVPVALKQWCQHTITREQREEKMALLRTNYAEVVQTTDTSQTAQRLLARNIGEIHNMGAADAALNQLDIEQADRHIVRSALCVADDLCLLERHDGHYELVAGCVTAPSYWRLRDKLGKTIAAVHDNVPELNSVLGERMHAFFERLPAERCLLRRNWFLHHKNDRFQPAPEHRSRVLTAEDAQRLTVRSETQTLRRLSDDVIVFTIAVECHALREIANYPVAAKSLQSAIRSRNGSEREAASQDSWELGVLAYLEQCI